MNMLTITIILSLFVIHRVNPVNPAKKMFVKNAAPAHTLFSQNKPNFQTAPITLTPYPRMPSACCRQPAPPKNKPNAKPNKADLPTGLSRDHSNRRPESVSSPDSIGKGNLFKPPSRPVGIPHCYCLMFDI